VPPCFFHSQPVHMRPRAPCVPPQSHPLFSPSSLPRPSPPIPSLNAGTLADALVLFDDGLHLGYVDPPVTEVRERASGSTAEPYYSSTTSHQSPSPLSSSPLPPPSPIASSQYVGDGGAAGADVTYPTHHHAVYSLLQLLFRPPAAPAQAGAGAGAEEEMGTCTTHPLPSPSPSLPTSVSQLSQRQASLTSFRPLTPLLLLPLPLPVVSTVPA
jgi:hypothetical protein